MTIHNSNIRNIALRDLTFIKMIVARFVATGNFLDIFHNKYTCRQFKNFFQDI